MQEYEEVLLVIGIVSFFILIGYVAYEVNQEFLRTHEQITVYSKIVDMKERHWITTETYFVGESPMTRIVNHYSYKLILEDTSEHSVSRDKYRSLQIGDIYSYKKWIEIENAR